MIAYLVQRSSLSVWAWNGRAPDIDTDHNTQPRQDRDDGGPMMVPEVLYPDRAAAEREAGRRDRSARRLLNPFWFGHPSYDGTAGSVAEFVRRLATAGLHPPQAIVSDESYPGPWAGWWDAEFPTMTDAQRNAVWNLLDEVRFYDVAEVELED